MQFDIQQRVSLGVAVLLFLYFLAHTLHLRNEAIRTGSVVSKNSSKEQAVKSVELPSPPKPSPTPSIPAAKHDKKPEPTPPHTDRSIKIGDGAQVTGSPMTTGDNSPLTINPELNPNAPIVTYEFNGIRHEQQGGRFSATAGDELGVFKRLIELQREHNWKEMYNLSESQIKETPEWLTPYLFSGIALANLGRKAEAIERLKFVDRMAAGQPDYSDAGRILGLLGDQQFPAQNH